MRLAIRRSFSRNMSRIVPWFHKSKLAALDAKGPTDRLLIAKDADHEGRKFFGWCRSHAHLHALIESTDPRERHYYENTARDQPCPLFFDVDGSSDGHASRSSNLVERLTAVVDHVNAHLFPDTISPVSPRDVFVLDSSHGDKLSFHVIYRLKHADTGKHVAFRNPKDLDRYYTLLDQDWDGCCLPAEVDKSVARVGAFRLMGCRKRRLPHVVSKPFRIVSHDTDPGMDGTDMLPHLDVFRMACVSHVPDDHAIFDVTRLDTGESDRPAKFVRVVDTGRHRARVAFNVNQDLPRERSFEEARANISEFMESVLVPDAIADAAPDMYDVLAVYRNANPSDGYDAWVQVARALKVLCSRTCAAHAGHEDAVRDFFRYLWHAYSHRSDKYDHGACDAKWDSLAPDAGADFDPMKFLFLSSMKHNYRDAIRLACSVEYTTLNRLDAFNWFGSRLASHYKHDPSMGLYVLNRISNRWEHHGKSSSPVANEFIDGFVGIELSNRMARFRGRETKEIDDRYKAIDDLVMTAGMEISIKRAIDFVTVKDFTSELDADPMVIAFTNCAVDLTTGMRYRVRPEHKLSKCTGFPYSVVTRAEEVEFESIIRSILHITDVCDWVMEFMSTGYIRKSIDKVPFLTSPPTNPDSNGSNGKSTLVNLVMGALGDYGCRLSGDSIGTADFSSPNAHTSHLNGLIGRRMAYIPEIPADVKIDPDRMIKPVTGGDPIKLRGLGKEEAEYRIYASLFATCNSLPSIESRNHATWRRFCAVWFMRWFTDQENVDPNNPMHVVRDESLNTPEKAAALRMAASKYLMRCARTFADRGFVMRYCREIEESTADFKESTDTLKDFLDTNFVAGSDEETQERRSWVTFKEFKDMASRKKFKHGRDRDFKVALESHYGKAFVREARVKSRNPLESGFLLQRKFAVMYGVHPIINFNGVE